MKKPKTKKPRASRRTRAERKANPGRPTPASTKTRETRLVAEEVKRSRERVFIRFGAMPETGISRDFMFQREEEGISCFKGYKNPGKGGGYTVDIPEQEGLLSAFGQATALINLIPQTRPIYVIEGASEVGKGGDGEPVVAGGTARLVSPFTPLELPDWFGEHGEQFARRWKQARKSVGFGNSMESRAAAQEALTKPAMRLIQMLTEEAEEDEWAATEEEMDLAKQRLEDVRNLPPAYRRLWESDAKHYPGGRGIIEQAAWEDEPWKGPNEADAPPATGEGVEEVEKLLSRATKVSRESQLHGPEHWKRVAVAGLELCREVPDANPFLVLRFALYHDAMRHNDGHDPAHGKRGGALARQVFGSGGGLSAEQLDLLEYACAHHTDGRISQNPTIGVCWDSDRLNLWRIGRKPAPGLLSTEAAKERIEWARDLQKEPCNWREIFKSYADFNSGERGDEVA